LRKVAVNEPINAATDSSHDTAAATLHLLFIQTLIFFSAIKIPPLAVLHACIV
jgi:hypothetical protein